jgi:hypothetical protein
MIRLNGFGTNHLLGSVNGINGAADGNTDWTSALRNITFVGGKFIDLSIWSCLISSETGRISDLDLGNVDVEDWSRNVSVSRFGRNTPSRHFSRYCRGGYCELGRVNGKEPQYWTARKGLPLALAIDKGVFNSKLMHI